MKSLSLLLLGVLALSLASCTTLANRRDLYDPAKPEGPYTSLLRHLDDPGPRLGAPNR